MLNKFSENSSKHSNALKNQNLLGPEIRNNRTYCSTILDLG